MPFFDFPYPFVAKGLSTFQSRLRYISHFRNPICLSYSSYLKKIRLDINRIVNGSSIIVTNTNTTEKFINNIYGYSKIIDYRYIDPNERNEIIEILDPLKK